MRKLWITLWSFNLVMFTLNTISSWNKHDTTETINGLMLALSVAVVVYHTLRWIEELVDDN